MSGRILLALTFSVLALLPALVALGEEGIWPLHELNNLPFEELAGRGLNLQRNDIYDSDAGGIADAVIKIRGGTATFVSAQGLLLTNHHVAMSAIQRASDVEHNYLRDGIFASSYAEEIPAIGFNLHIELGSEDVTERVLAAVDEGMDDRQRYEALEQVKKEIIQEGEEGGDVQCRIAGMHGGTRYMLYTNFEIKDLRIVHAPPISVGTFGGDIDNWMWPRHSADYCFLRAYVGPDGASADYHEANIPYESKAFLPFSTAGVRENDIALVIGFPGRTERYASSFYVENRQKHFYPLTVSMLGEFLGMLEGFADQNEEYAIRLAARMQGLNNLYKNNQGMLAGFESSGLLERKQRMEEELAEFLGGDAEMNARYGHVLPELEAAYQERAKTRRKDFMFSNLGRASNFYGMASQIYKWSLEREMPDMERERGFQARDVERARKFLEHAQINLLPDVDRVAFSGYLPYILDLPAEQRVAVIDSIFAGVEEADRDRFLNEWLDRLYGGSTLGDLESRLAMFEMSRAQLDSLGDPFIDLARALEPEMEALRERGKWFLGVQSRLEPQLIAAYAAWKKGRLYPDANNTKRFNYGFVEGYGPCEDPRIDYLTTLGGLLAKETGEDPFFLPERFKVACEAGDFGDYIDPVCGDLPVNFLSSNDGTGGSSGSPVINGDGMIIGLVFDRNYESIAADYLYDQETTRSISVDIRYMLWLIEKVYWHDALLDELTFN